MAAPTGNKFWLKRSSHGRKPIFGSPDKLWDADVLRMVKITIMYIVKTKYLKRTY